MLDRATIERMLAKSGDRPIVVAMSGGGDSVALVHLLVEHLGPGCVHAVIVDHALREGSAADAARAREFAIPLGVQAEIVTLEWRDAPPRSQQAARTARYRALCDAARRAGACAIALGHTADDQAETVLMRAAAGSGWRGLAGMAPIAPAPVWPEGRGVTLARPLIHVRRAALRGYLEARSAPWLEDPANTNPAFGRVRVRERLAALEASDFDPMRLARMASGLRLWAVRVDAAAAKLLTTAVRFEDAHVVIDRNQWVGDGLVRQRTLAVLLMAAAGGDRAPEPSALERLDARMMDAAFRGAALAGARVAPRKRDIVIERDLGALLGRAGGARRAAPLPLPAGEEVIWDGRIGLIAATSGWTAEPTEDGAPELVLREERLSLSAVAGSVAITGWLVEAHAKHLLELC